MCAFSPRRYGPIVLSGSNANQPLLFPHIYAAPTSAAYVLASITVQDPAVLVLPVVLVLVLAMSRECTCLSLGLRGIRVRAAPSTTPSLPSPALLLSFVSIQAQ